MGREGQCWHKPVSISFPPTQKTLTKLREVAWLHTREVSPRQRRVSALTFQHQLPLLPTASPNFSHPWEQALPLIQQLSGCWWSFPTSLKTPSCHSSRGTVPAVPPTAS